MITPIQTLSELRRVWTGIIGAFKRDFTLTGRLAANPIRTMRELGYEVSGEAATALLKCVP
ncbi:MAG: hypothetical protein ACI9MR_002607 [Myxococcota bacterium]|jgi:hypothetical protein